MERYELYFAGNALVILAAIGLLWWSRNQGQKRKLIIYISILFLAMFNDLVYRLVIVRIGETETYYRFLWILPVNVMAAYLVVEVASLLKGWKKGAILVILAGFLVANAMPGISSWTTLPTNVYQLDDEVIEIADMIDAHSGGKRVNVIDSDYTAIWHMREYNDNINYLGLWDEGIRTILGREADYYEKSVVQEAICNSAVRYIIVRNSFENANKSLQDADVELIGQTQNYNVYYTNLDQLREQ